MGKRMAEPPIRFFPSLCPMCLTCLPAQACMAVCKNMDRKFSYWTTSMHLDIMCCVMGKLYAYGSFVSSRYVDSRRAWASGYVNSGLSR
ncbi:hypothetical protein GGR53DRAFT_480729 [Hypoxylon sp. FL1150]|nr:hypothetical protein GGR53DRAFT_480729 [Hypoxylon sp. FL1150]